MAYEVIKRTSGRAYKYRVEYLPADPADPHGPRSRTSSGKLRAKWTYLGRVTDDPLCPLRPKRDTGAALAAALHRLLAPDPKRTRHPDPYPLAEISVSQITAEAGTAYGTFYRYFRSIADLTEHTLAPCTHCAGNGWNKP